MSTPFESFGKYVLLEKLATGGMAEVFLARGSGAGGIGKFFAIKRILPQFADSPEFIDMFKEEAKIAINLSHSNIVSIHEFGVEKGQFFLVMDYVEGRNLRQIQNKMKKSGLQFSIDQIINIVKEVAAGLDHAHRCIDGTTGKPLNITHRDMSPQNVMVSFEGETRIVDFGIAKAESQIETTRAGTLKGKFGYMSPEQAEGLPVDLRTDIFSLGIVLWELLANDRLFVANNEINTLRKIRDCQIPSLRKINPNIHTELERIVQKALARDRNLRYQTGAALHRDLNRFLNRQYPDFSPQDFAVFIKSVFADEILSLRKRLLEYARMNLGQNSKSPVSHFADRTAVLDTGTNSLVIAESQVTSKQDEVSVTNKQITAKEITAETVATHTLPKTSFSRADSEPTHPDSDFAQATHNEANSLPPPRMAAAAPVFDEEALATALETDIQRNKSSALETEDISSPGFKTRHQNTRINGRYRKGPPPKSKSNSQVRIATLIVFVLACTSIYTFLVKFSTPMMTDVILMTDPLLHEFHSALGVNVANLNSANEATAPLVSEPRNPASPQTSATPSLTPTQLSIAAAAAAAANATSAATLEATKPHANATDLPSTATSAVLIISNPSGAEIFIDDKGTGFITPSRIEVPAKGSFSISLRKHGFADFKQNNVTREQLPHRLTYNLMKTNVAYLDIDVFPPQDAVIYINGKLITGRFPIRELPVMANQTLTVRAQTKSGNSFDEVKLSLPVDKRQTIQLNPRKSIRLPSNAPNQ